MLDAARVIVRTSVTVRRPLHSVWGAENYGAGVWREPALGAGGGTFVLATLATVVFDGISQTNTYLLWEADLFEWQVWFSYHITLFQTLFMVAIVGGFALLYLAICVALSRSDEDTIAETARRFTRSQPFWATRPNKTTLNQAR
jgi:hypothetical protein